MKKLAIIALIMITSSSALMAETFFERFKSLENRVDSVQTEVNGIKATLKKSGVKIENTQTQNQSSDELNSLQESIDELKNEQSALKSMLKELKKSSHTVVVAPAKASPQSSEEADEDDDEGDDEADDEEVAKNDTANIQESDGDEEEADEDEEGDDEEDDEDEGDDEEDDEDMSELEELQAQVDEINSNTNGSHLKMTIDFRTSSDTLNYKAADGTIYKNDAFLANRLWINMKYKANPNISFNARLAYNKPYGEQSGTGPFVGFSNFDWIENEAPYEHNLIVSKAYYLYKNQTFLGLDMPWTFSLGRRPSTNGHLINLRDDDEESSPLGHSINVEFDGGSIKYDFSNLTGIQGMYIKLCFGRGLSNAQETFSSAPYATSSSGVSNVDLGGFIFSLYNDGQYKVITQTYKAWNLIGIDGTKCNPFTQTDCNFKNVGDLTSFTINVIAEGLGDEISDYLDETILFASYAISQTNPTNSAVPMLGSSTAQTGSSYWIGAQFPSFTDDGKFGIEYNQGDKYWRSVTYAEDTLIGSKVAARGKAYEIYWTEPFAEGSMSWQLRYTYIDYDYTGSNGFFGSGGAPMTMSEAIAAGMGAYAIDVAQDLRFYIRYRY